MQTLRLQKNHIKAIASGVPWVMRHQAVESSEWLLAEPGSLATIEGERGEFIGIGMVNPLSQIVCRMLTRAHEPIDETFFAKKFSEALAKRDALFPKPYYRLMHAEADGLPGLVIDRFDDLYVIQVTSAGMERLQPLWLAALEAVVSPKTILLRNDLGVRVHEGLESYVRVIKGEVPPRVHVHENDCTYIADVVEGQKTGWFYDMRDNRKMIAELVKGKTMLDVFSHSGGFGLLAATQGAAHVTMVDASAKALALAIEAAKINHVADRVETIKGDAVEIMKNLAGEGKRYDIVITDPPAYVKSKKDIASGLKGYAKVAAYAAPLVAPGGYLFIASCSHHAGRSAFNKVAIEGIERAGRSAEIIKQTGASRDHPTHPQLAQSEYLKGLLLTLN